jgi:hypothetical protein
MPARYFNMFCRRWYYMDTDEIYEQHVILTTKIRRRNKLQLQLALLGSTADPSISMQIEDLEKEIAQLSRKLTIKPEGIFIDTSVNLKDRRVLLLQVAYDDSNTIMNHFSSCIQLLIEYDEIKRSGKDTDAIDEIKRKLIDKGNELWAECSVLFTIFKENRLFFPKKADLAISGLTNKIFRFINIDWSDYEDNLKDEALGWNDYIIKAHRAIVDVMRTFIESENKN